MLTKKVTLAAIFLTIVYSAGAQVIMLDFGHPDHLSDSSEFNNVYAPSGGSMADIQTDFSTLRDSSGSDTGITLSVVQADGGGVDTGPDQSVGIFPATAATDYFWDSDSATLEFTFGNMDTGMAYDFELFGSREDNPGSTSDRTSIYTITGLNSGSASLDATNNLSTVFINGITPTGDGEIDFTVEGAGSNFFYVNAMSVTAVPEPSTYAFFGGMAILGVVILRRRLT